MSFTPDVVSEVPHPSELTPEVVADAWSIADSSARRAGVRIRPVHDAAGLATIATFLAETWRTSPGNDPIPPDVLCSITHSGSPPLAAFTDDVLVGATAAVFCPPHTRSVYSLVAAAVSDRGVGLALKQAQRGWALERGVTTMTWTFDPLVSRNGRFNLVKLGAVATAYLVDFYGPMTDGINHGDESDRLTIRWDLTQGLTRTPRVPTDPENPVGDAAPGEQQESGDPEAPDAGRSDSPSPDVLSTVDLGPDGLPFVGRDGELLWCRVPRDIVALRREDVAQALAWRRAVREVLAPAFARGHVATSMSRDGWYRLAPGRQREQRTGQDSGSTGRETHRTEQR